MSAKSRQLYQVIREVRTCFNNLKSLSDDMHRDLGITASMRAVQECLLENGEMTVPQIASIKGVSRQHIQVTVHALLESGLVTLRDNPDHLRSPFVALTQKGRDAFKTIQGREHSALETLAQEHRLEHLNDTAATLKTLTRGLRQMQADGTHVPNRPVLPRRRRVKRA
ncbi:MAG: hypothetical protein U0172_02515 [Nitrospiraceae bacterium]